MAGGHSARGIFTRIRPSHEAPKRSSTLDLIYIALGCGVLAGFGLYAAMLRRI
jgi:hypothetical protein